jgi:hypothetical protein
MSNVIEQFGNFKTISEVQKYLAEKYGYDISTNKLAEIRTRNLDKIKPLQEKWEESIDEYSVTHKKGQVERLVYLLNTQLDEYKRDHQYPVKRSTEIRNILNQIWGVVGGNKLVVDINQNIDITATINMNMTLRQITQKVSVNSFIVGMVATKMGIDPLKLMYKLQNTCYKSYNGFTQEQPVEDMVYPSGLINQYDWDAIKRKHENTEVEDVKIIEETAQPVNIHMKSRLLELMGAKITELEKGKIGKK